MDAFWALMRKGEYKQFKDDILKHKMRRKNILLKIYYVIFFFGLISLISIWVIKGT